jgi:hypothetical protein
MGRRSYNPWLRVGLNAWALGLEASTVIGLRALRLAQGGAKAEQEASLMVTEKLAAAQELAQAGATGALGSSAPAIATRVLKRYRQKVRANRRRLSE